MTLRNNRINLNLMFRWDQNSALHYLFAHFTFTRRSQNRNWFVCISRRTFLRSEYSCVLLLFLRAEDCDNNSWRIIGWIRFSVRVRCYHEKCACWLLLAPSNPSILSRFDGSEGREVIKAQLEISPWISLRAQVAIAIVECKINYLQKNLLDPRPKIFNDLPSVNMRQQHIHRESQIVFSQTFVAEENKFVDELKIN